jgi:Phosphopantetheine attachment site
MKPRAMDSLDAVQIVMAIEEVFEVEILDADPESLGSPREIVDWLELQLSNQRPNKAARELLRKLAHKQQPPELSRRLGWALAA